MTAPNPKPYDRQPTDTDKSWAAFCVYRDMGGDRSVEKTWRKCGYKHHSLVTQWCTKHNWVKRCSAFDDDELQKESIALQKLRLDRRLKMEKDSWVKQERYAAKAKQMLNIPIATSLTTEDGKTVYNPTDKWSIKDAIALDEYAHKLAIFATGGDRPNMTEIDAVKVLAQAGLLPAEILEAAERGGDALKSMLTEAFQNLSKPTTDS